MSEQFEKEVLRMLKKQEKTLNEHSKMLENQEKFNKEFRIELNEVKDNLNYVSNDLRNFSRHFAVFETDFGLKVDVLFEKYDTDFSQHKIFKKHIDSLENQSFKHDVQIEHLSKKLANA